MACPPFRSTRIHTSNLFSADAQATMHWPCQVRGCRYADSHTTRGHRCGTCGQYGHGILECPTTGGQCWWSTGGASWLTQTMPLGRTCNVVGCMTYTLHDSTAHHCHSCGARGGGVFTCCAIALDHRFSGPTLSPPSPRRPPLLQLPTPPPTPPTPLLSHEDPPPTDERPAATSLCLSNLPDELKTQFPCPICRTQVTVEHPGVFTGTTCSVCFESRPLAVLTCRHAHVCTNCLTRMCTA